MGLIERQTPRQPILTQGGQLVTSDHERDLDLAAGRVLIARDLGVRAAALAAVKQMPAKPSTDPFTRRRRRVGLCKRPRARFAPKRPLAPTQIRRPPRDREITDPHPVALPNSTSHDRTTDNTPRT